MPIKVKKYININGKESSSSGGTGGTTNYNELTNKPQINDVELIGNKTSDELGLQNKLIAGEGIVIENDVISSSGSGGTTDYEDLENKPSINGVTLSGNKTTEDLGITVNVKSALQVTCSYNNDVLKGVAVVVDQTEILTKNNGLATFTGLDKGEKTIEASKDGYHTYNTAKQINNPFEFADIVLNPVELTFTVTDEQSNALAGATVTLIKGEESFTQTTNNNGQAVFSGIVDGTYSYSISLNLYDSSIGTIVIDRNNVSEPVIMFPAPVDCYAEEAVSIDNEVKVNMGIGNSNTDYNVYAANTAVTNELTLDGLARATGNVGDTVPVRITYNDAEINVITDEDDTDIQFNNNNDINEVSINVVAKDLYIAFTQNDKTMYFKNDTRPFVVSENSFASKSYTYYTYSNNVMSAHTATTSSVSVGANTYDGITLNINTTEDIFSNGIWIKDETKNIEIDDGTAAITTSGYLTTPQPTIPRTNYFRFALGKLNSDQWETKLLIGGQEKKFINYQEFIVQANQLIEIYQTKKGSTSLIDSFCQYFYISNDKIFKKVNFLITSNHADTTFKFTVNGVKFEYVGSAANLDLYEGQTVTWEVSKDTFATQTGSYTVPSYPTISSYTVSVTLITNSVTFRTFEKQNQAIETVGNLTIVDGIASGFTATDYLQTTVPFAPGNNSWSIKVPFTITSLSSYCGVIGSTTKTDYQGIALVIQTDRRVNLFLSRNGTSWNIAAATGLTPALNLNQQYYAWITFDGNNTYQLKISTDNQNWTTYITVTSTAKIYTSSGSLCIGANIFNSTGERLQGTINVNGIEIFIKQSLASVDIINNGDNYTTDSNGLLTISGLSNGDHTYVAQKVGYLTQRGEYKMEGVNLSKEIIMEAQ